MGRNESSQNKGDDNRGKEKQSVRATLPLQLLVRLRTSRVGSSNKGATNLLPRTEIPMSAANQMTSLGEGELCHSFAEVSRVGGERSWH